MVIIRRNPDGSIAGQEGQPTQSHPALATKMGMQALQDTGRAVPPLMSEIATKINNAKDKPRKLKVLKDHDSVPLRQVLKGAFDPSIYIKEHILKGDRSDGIPNVLSDDNVFVENRRQKPLSKKKLKGWIDDIFFYNTFTEEEERNYNRNRKLIDLSSIPQHIEDKINDEFLNVKVATRDKILGYFINKKLKTLIEVIDEF